MWGKIYNGRDIVTKNLDIKYPTKDGECNIHFVENWSGRDPMCLTPWILIHRSAHTFSDIYGSDLGYYNAITSLQKILNSLNLEHICSKDDIKKIKSYINVVHGTPEEKEENSHNTYHLGLGFYPDMIPEINSFLLRGRAAREKLRLIDGDVLGEILSTHHFGRGKFTFQDQTNINEDFLSVSKDEYLSTITTADKFITEYINNLLAECRGKNLIF